MNHRHGHRRRFVVYGGCGETISDTCEITTPPDTDPPPTAGEPAQVGLRHLMTDEVICGRDDLEISAVVELMTRHHIGCLPIVDQGRRPIGIITKSDLVEHLREQRGRTADDVMMPLALSLPATASVTHAASMMTLEDTHHVLVVESDGRLAGVVSSRDLVTWLAKRERSTS
jgi:CBS domain-containing protein